MVIFKNSTAVKFLAITFIIINIIHADKISVAKQCLNQILYAFGRNHSTKGCLKYAIEHYIKDEYIEIEEDLISTEDPKSSKPLTRVYSFENLISGAQKDLVSDSKSAPPIRVDNFEDLVSNRQKVRIIEKPIPTRRPVEPERRFKPNYAMLYHNALETMVQGIGVPKRLDFCLHFFKCEFQSCLSHLVMFGNTAKSAVLKAFTSYKLDSCTEDNIIHTYMQVIIYQCNTSSPSKKPETFCNDLEKKQLSSTEKPTEQPTEQPTDE